MLKNYLRIYIRSIRKQKAYSLITILGLAIGLSVFILVLTIFDFNLSFDTFHKDPERIYLVTTTYMATDGSTQRDAYSRLPLANLLSEKYPEIEHASTERRYFRNTFRYQDKKFYEKGVLFADTSFLKIFNYPVIAGDAESPLAHPHSVVLTESASKRYFGDENPVGKMLTNDFGDDAFNVTAVIKDCPFNCSNPFDILVAMPSGYDQDWGIQGNTYTFLKLKAGASAALLESKFPAFIDEQVPILRDARARMSLLPMMDIHLRSMDINSGFSITPIFQYYLVLAIAVGLLIVVSINFMILSTSRYNNRAKEVGIRKAVGAARGQLIAQYIGESMLTALIALPVAIVLFEMIRPGFIAIVGGGIELSLTQNPLVFAIIIGVTLCVGFSSGIYPAFFLSSFQPASIIRIQSTSGKNKINLRKLLILSQFSLTFVMITATLLLMKQLNMMSRIYLGYDRENILAIPCTFAMGDKFDVFEKELKGHPNITMVANARFLPFGGGYRKDQMRVAGMDEKSAESIDSYPCGRNFIEILNIKIIEGRSFSREFNDSNSVIVSEGAARHFHLTHPVGEKLYFDSKHETKTIVGVARDFHFPHVFLKKVPAVLFSQPLQPFYVFVKTSEKPDDQTLGFIRSKWNEVAPELPFDYFMLDNQFQDQLRSSSKSLEIFGSISVICMIVASLGLFALASFTAEKRTKEIGIRKVLGASFANITFMLLSEFILIVVVADFVALPFAYFLSRYLVTIGWVYRTDIGLSLFAATAVASIIAALSAVLVQSVRSARANPVEALRYE
ncbi:MAG TPA: ABC transporter permease [Bacteroidota bacterium]|nr:ABC transporter permease [Bacteroidota bacterium]